MDLHSESSPEGVGLGSGQLSRDADGSDEEEAANSKVEEVINDHLDNAFSIPPWLEGLPFDDSEEQAQEILEHLGAHRFAPDEKPRLCTDWKAFFTRAPRWLHQINTAKCKPGRVWMALCVLEMVAETMDQKKTLTTSARKFTPSIDLTKLGNIAHS